MYDGPVRVLHLTSSYPRHDGDSNGPYLAELARAQAAAGMEPMVLAPHGPGLDEDDTVAGVPVHRFRYAPEQAERLAYRGSVMSAARHPVGALALPGFLAAFAVAARRQARLWRADVVHAHWWLPAGAAAVTARAAGGRAAVVITCHGTDVHIAHGPIMRRAASAVLRRADLVAAVSEALAAEVEATVPGIAPVVLRMPFRAGQAPPPPAGAAGRAGINVLAVGRVFPEKGYDVVVAAIGALAGRGVRVHLRLMGNGPMVPVLRRAAEESGVSDQVTFLGSGSREAMFSAIDNCDAVVVPSRREGLGLVALDAISRGRPVLASAVGGLVETMLGSGGPRAREIEETPLGLLVPAEDVTAWADALGRVASWAASPDRRTGRGRDAVQLVLGRHDPEQVAKDHLQAYETALSSRR